jgi:hypothetical protein
MGGLSIGDKKLLIVRGSNTEQTVCQVYLEFSRRTDNTGHQFQFSKSKRGITEHDRIWNQIVRVTPKAMEDYVKSWFALGELLHTAVGEVIILVSELPKMSVNLWVQGRYVAQHAALFEFVD